MAYEIFYAFTTTSTLFEKTAFLVWFLFDVTFTSVAISSAYAPSRRTIVAIRTVSLVAIGIVALYLLCMLYPDEREQVTAFWVGVVLQLPISVGSLWLLIQRNDVKGHSLEIWYADPIAF